MRFSLSNNALLRGMLAGAVVLTGTACSRSDRAESGSDTTAATLPDTSTSVPQPSGADTATGAAGDTAAKPGQSSSTQPSSPARSDSVRADTAPPSGKDTAGYRPMERDTTSVPTQPADSALPDTSVSTIPEATDTAAIDASAEAADTTSTEMAGATDTAVRVDVDVDTTAMGTDTAAVEMARDTSTVVDQADTAAVPSGDVAVQTTVDTSAQDSAQVSVETEVAQTDVAVVADSADTVETDVAVVVDSTEILGQVTDSTAEAGTPDTTEMAQVRPPEDSTEILGNVTTTDEAVDETADEYVVRPEDREAAAVSETRTDEVGAAAIAGDVTGAEAVALMSREGVRCAVVDPEVNETVRWDMSNTPVTLNPCGMGSMVLSRIGVEGSAGQE
jgi:hypothetical protein